VANVMSTKLNKHKNTNKNKKKKLDKSELECLRCKKKGHFARECLAPAPVQAVSAPPSNSSK
jgi:hypothetical protein